MSNFWQDKSGYSPDLKEKLEISLEHIKLFEKEIGNEKNFALMKKHFKTYLSGKALAASGVSGFDGAAELRVKLVEGKTAKEVERVIKDFLYSKFR